MKINIEQLKTEIADAKTRHTEATKDIKRIEKDMSEFNDNKDDKLAELQSSVEKLKKTQIKNSVSVKSLQKEVQSARMESEQAASDIATAQDQLAEVHSSLKAQQSELQDLQDEQRQAKVSLPRSKRSHCCLWTYTDRSRTPTIKSKPVSPTNEPS